MNEINDEIKLTVSLMQTNINDDVQFEAQHFTEELGNVIRPLYPVSWGSLVGGE